MTNRIRYWLIFVLQFILVYDHSIKFKTVFIFNTNHLTTIYNLMTYNFGLKYFKLDMLFLNVFFLIIHPLNVLFNTKRPGCIKYYKFNGLIKFNESWDTKSCLMDHQLTSVLSYLWAYSIQNVLNY